ncbi:MAG TPA: hypothetical protein VGQ17_18690 [Gemmatimonadales bacterium]|nr:hypothetical protein [Gemmatimonadales bacterium]
MTVQAFRVHIELTDHLCCPAGHAERFLVLLPDAVDGRRVVSGTLGCPVCGRVVRLAEGSAIFDQAAPSDGRTALTAEALAAFLGLSGPGGYIALVGGVTSLAGELAALLPGIRLALVNPPPGTADLSEASVLRAARLPLKASSMRGVALGADLAGHAAWVADAVRATLPGLRIVAEGGEPPSEGVELLARAEECWVGKKQGVGSRE